NGKWQMANGKWQIANRKWQMANGKSLMANRKWQIANRQSTIDKRLAISLLIMSKLSCPNRYFLLYLDRINRPYPASRPRG
ncbi:MAG: hypothetical protein ACE5NM_08770, partial [Sedimentisphaerales bacterium]